jgi:hypothetical protein
MAEVGGRRVADRDGMVMGLGSAGQVQELVGEALVLIPHQSQRNQLAERSRLSVLGGWK